MNIDPYQQKGDKGWAPELREVMLDNIEHPPHPLRLGKKQRALLERVVADVTKAHRILDGYEIPGGPLADRLALVLSRSRLTRPE
jgi:hypothetical protein